MATIRNTPKDSPWPYQLVCGVTLTRGGLDTNVFTVTAQLLNQNSGNLAQVGKVDWWIASNATGTTPVGSVLSGGVAAGTYGTVVSQVTGKNGFALSDTSGRITFSLTDSGNSVVYLAIGLPDGSIAVSDRLTFSETGTGT